MKGSPPPSVAAFAAALGMVHRFRQLEIETARGGAAYKAALGMAALSGPPWWGEGWNTRE